MKNAKSAKSSAHFKIEKRIQEALGVDSRREIADKMEVNYQTLSNWLNGRADFPSDFFADLAKRTDYSLNWILTGDGEKRAAKPTLPEIISVDEEALFGVIKRVVAKYLEDQGLDFEVLRSLSREAIREIVRQEMSDPGVQQLGTVDEFDLAKAIEKHDNPATVLEEWYRAEGWPLEQLSVPAFKGWDGYTLDQKVKEIRAFVEGHRRHIERQNVLPPKAA